MVGSPTDWRPTPNDPTDWFPAAQIERSRAYQRPLARVRVLRAALGAALLVLVAFAGIGEWIVDHLGGSSWVSQLIVLALALQVGNLAFDLPLDAWVDLRHDRRWELSTQTGPGLLADTAKSFVLTSALTVLLLVPFWWLLRTTDLWWLWAWLGFLGFSLVLGFAFPILIAPIFNTFEPLREGELADRLARVADTADASIGGIQVADASRRSRRDNAYVAGLGATRRVVLFDTLLEHPAESIEQVVAHELGHWKLRHLTKQLPVVALTTLAMFLALAALGEWDALWSAAGAESIADPIALPVVMLAVGALASVVGLASAFVSRAFERQADRYGLELLDRPEQMLAMHRRLHVKNLADLTPSRLTYLRATHPPAAERLAFAHAWGLNRGHVLAPPEPKPETDGLPLR